jgi:hypothetical protein
MSALVVPAAVLVAVALAIVAVLLAAVLRRLREHEVRLAALTTAEVSVIAGPGHPVGDLPVALPALVGFFSPSCSGCEERLPGFVDAAGGHAGGVLAVVVDDGDPGPLATRLAEVAEVVVEAPQGPLASEFAVTGFPAFALVDDDGRIRWGGFELVPAPV